MATRKRGKKVQNISKSIAIIGGGPKAVAIATKAQVLNDNRLATLKIRIFEEHEIGANWSGRNGYTDGVQLLCTPAERDLGFPYQSILGGKVCAQEMQARYSWQAYLVSKGTAFSEWVDRGRLPPAHREFAGYLTWAIAQTSFKVTRGKVKELVPTQRSNKWRVTYSVPGTNLVSEVGPFDGVVVTGPGESKHVRTTKGSIRVIDGVRFWLDPARVVKLLATGSKEDRGITIIGGGGTAAAIAAKLIRLGLSGEKIVIVADQATLFSRVESAFENELFSNEGTWAGISPKNRKQFADRLNRGVVWGSVLEQLKHARALRCVDGRAVLIDPAPKHIDVYVESWNRTPALKSSVVIDASGFNPWWFASLLPNDRRPKDSEADLLVESMREDLSFKHATWTLPLLHAPMLSARQGAGFLNLMSLGGMADRILRSYL